MKNTTLKLRGYEDLPIVEPENWEELFGIARENSAEDVDDAEVERRLVQLAFKHEVYHNLGSEFEREIAKHVAEANDGELKAFVGGKEQPFNTNSQFINSVEYSGDKPDAAGGAKLWGNCVPFAFRKKSERGESKADAVRREKLETIRSLHEQLGDQTLAVMVGMARFGDESACQALLDAATSE